MVYDSLTVDDILCGGTSEFKSEVNDPFSKIFVIWSQFFKTFTYLGLEINQNKDNSVIISQEFMLAPSTQHHFQKICYPIKNPVSHLKQSLQFAP